jgi:DNA-binding NtrC family response regulator
MLTRWPPRCALILAAEIKTELAMRRDSGTKRDASEVARSDLSGNDRAVTYARKQLILIVDSDAHFREGLYNFLLSAGYEKVDSADNYRSALEKTRETEYDVVLLDAGSTLNAGRNVADGIAASSPKTRVILMVGTQEPQELNDEAGSKAEYQYLIKATFARNLLFLLDRDA